MRFVVVVGMLANTLVAQNSGAYFRFDLTSNQRDLRNYGPARLARILGADSLAIDRTGNLYFPSSGMIRRIATDGTITPLTTPVPNQLGSYRFLAVDPQDNLYFEDGTYQVVRLTPAGVAETWVPAAAIPNGIVLAMAAGNQGELYILSIARVIRIGSDRSITEFAGTGRLGFSGDSGPANEAMIYAQGIAVDKAGTVYLADTGNDRIRAIDRDGIIRTVAGVSRPQYVLPADRGTLYVTSPNPPVIYEVDEAVHTVTIVAGQPFAAPYWGDEVPASQARLVGPGAMALDRTGSLYFADGTLIRRISPNGTLTTVAGCGCGLESVPVTWLSPSSAFGIARDAGGNLYYSDRTTHQVWRVGTGGIATVIAGKGGSGFSGDGGPAIDARLSWPAGVAVDAAGNVYIADEQNHRVRQVTPAGIIRTVAGNGDATILGAPDGVAVDPAGNLYVSDTTGHRVLRLAANGTLVMFAGSGAVGSGGDGGPATAAQLVNPRGLAIDNDGGLLIADSSAHRVRKVMPDGTIRALLIDPPGAPYAAIPDNRGGVLVAEYGSHRVVRVDAQGSVQTLFTIGSPTGIVSGSDGTLYVAGSGPSAWRLVDAAPFPLAPAISSEGVANAAGRIAGVVSPGEIVSVYGSWLGPKNGVVSPTSAGSIGMTLAGVRVLFDEFSAPVLYAGADQINAVVPFEIAGRGRVSVRTEFNGSISNMATIPVLAVAPALFQPNSYLAALNQDNSVNGSSRPAKPGEVVSLFSTGAGVMLPALATGEIAGTTLSRVIAPVRASVGGENAEVLYAGSAPGFVAGAVQINVRIPETALSGSVTIQIGGQTVSGDIFLSH